MPISDIENKSTDKMSWELNKINRNATRCVVLGSKIFRFFYSEPIFMVSKNQGQTWTFKTIQNFDEYIADIIFT